MRRVQVVVRLGLLVALVAVARSSLWWIFWGVYLALPVVAALLIARTGADGYLAGDGPRILRVLRWVAGAYAYMWSLTDEAPSTGLFGPVELSVAVSGRPTPGSAVLRLITSLPALFFLAILSIVAAFFWVFAALSILATERVPAGITEFVAMKLRFQLRLIAYHLSLVEAYPSLAEPPLSHAPHSGTT